MKRKRKVWIVETSFQESGRFHQWHPTVGVALCRGDGRQRLREWAGRNPDDRFRLRAYEVAR